MFSYAVFLLAVYNSDGTNLQLPSKSPQKPQHAHSERSLSTLRDRVRETRESVLHYPLECAVPVGGPTVVCEVCVEHSSCVCGQCLVCGCARFDTTHREGGDDDARDGGGRICAAPLHPPPPPSYPPPRHQVPYHVFVLTPSQHLGLSWDGCAL